MAADDQPDRLPKLAEMQAAGMGITEALAFWNEMANDPDRPAAHWWQELHARVSARSHDPLAAERQRRCRARKTALALVPSP